MEVEPEQGGSLSRHRDMRWTTAPKKIDQLRTNFWSRSTSFLNHLRSKKSSISMLLNDFCFCLVDTRRVFDVSHMNCFSFWSKLKQDEIKFSRRHFFLHSSKLAVLRFCKCTKKTDSCYSGNCDCFILPLCTSLTFALSVCESEWVWECVWFSTSFLRLVERCHPLSPSPSLATTLSLSLYLYLQHKLMVRVPSFSLYFLPDRNIFCPHSIAGESQSIFSAPPFFLVFFQLLINIPIEFFLARD